jgi:hypothetical protein
LGIYAKDFDNNGSIGTATLYLKDQQGVKRISCDEQGDLEKLPSLKRDFSYKRFCESSYPPGIDDQMKDATILHANNFSAS